MSGQPNTSAKKGQHPNHLLAQKLSAAGIPVFPCREATTTTLDGTTKKSKAPYTANGFKDATTDLSRIDKWWRSWPNAVPGIPTGRASGLSVIDGDLNRETGESDGERWIKDNGFNDPLAVCVRTQSGGVQFLFQDVEGGTCTTSQVAAHVDTRCEGGYIVAPGSIMANGNAYKYEGRKLSNALTAGDLPPFPLHRIKAAVQARKKAKGHQIDEERTRQKESLPGRFRPGLADGFRSGIGSTEATDAETLDVLRGLLTTAPNELDRNDWVKLAMSLRVVFGEVLLADFVNFSMRFSGGSPCLEVDAQRVWNSASDPKEVSNIAPALSLLREAVGEVDWKAAWSMVFGRRSDNCQSESIVGDGADTMDEYLAAQPPNGFKLTRKGIHREIKDKEGNSDWRWLCSPVRVLALPRGADGKGWGRLVDIQDPDGQWHRWTVRAEHFAGDGLELRREALRLGMNIDSTIQGRHAFSVLLQQWRPKARATTTARLGWTDDTCEAFLLGSGKLIGGKNVVFQSETLPGIATEMRARGTLEGWKDAVGSLCVGNPLAVLTVSLAFSGPLLEPMKHEGGGLHLRGESSRGKSTILRLAVSIWGAPGLLQSWRATSNGLEGVAATCNGSLIALDEMSEVSAREAGGAVYMLANGTGKARANRAGMARPVARWRTAILSSGELSLADKMAEAGQRKRAGQDVRLIDIQADARTYGAFDNLHNEKDGAALAERMNLAAAQAYGTAGPAFVSHLLDDMPAAIIKARELSGKFVAKAIAQFATEADGQVKRVLGRIGLIVSAGEMATEMGITGWPEGEAIRAGLELARAWLVSRGGSGAQEARDAIDRTRAFIVKFGDSRFQDLDTLATERNKIINRAGWKQSSVYYIAKDAWNEIHAGCDPANAARAVRNAGFLVQEEPNRLVKRAPTAVDGRPRCYCVKTVIMGSNDG